MSDQQTSLRQEQRIRSMIVDQIRENELYLNRSDIQNHMVEFLCFKKTDEIRLILMGWNYITVVGVTHFQKAKWTNLSNLSLWHNRIGSNGCKQLSKVSFQQLRYLNLNENYIQDHGVHHLSKLKVPTLIKIQLQCNNLCSKTVHHLIKANWRRMQKIDVFSNNIRIDGVPYLITTSNKLDLLRLNDNKITDASARNIVDQMKSKFQRIEVHL